MAPVRKILPLGDRVLVKSNESGEVMRSGIIIPDTAKEKPQEGKVIAAGPGRRNEEGVLIPLDLKVGDKIIYAKYGGSEIKENGEDLLLMRESDVLAKVG